MNDMTEEPALLSERQLALLQAIAHGATVAEVASARGMSERQVRRILRQVWQALGVEGRNQGLVRAGRWGLVDA